MNIKKGIHKNFFLFYDYDMNMKKLNITIKSKKKVHSEKICVFLEKLGLTERVINSIRNGKFYDVLIQIDNINIDKIKEIVNFYRRESRITYNLYQNDALNILEEYFNDVEKIDLNRPNIPLLVFRFKKENIRILSLKLYDINFEFDDKNDYKGGIRNAYSIGNE